MIFSFFFRQWGGGALLLFLAVQNDRLILGQCESDGAVALFGYSTRSFGNWATAAQESPSNTGPVPVSALSSHSTTNANEQSQPQINATAFGQSRSVSDQRKTQVRG